MNKQTKKEWLQELKEKTNVNIRFEIKVNGKKQRVSYFYKYAEEEFKNDKELNVLNFAKSSNPFEIPEGMVDFDFIKNVFKVKEIANIFQLSYEFKNNKEEKKFLKNCLEIFASRQVDCRRYEIMWTFEPGFWSDLNFTRKIKNYDYDYLDLSIVKELNKSQVTVEQNYLIEIINENPYYLKYIKHKTKSLLPEKTILKYVRDYGIKSITKEQKDNYKVIKEAFYNNKISYSEIDEKWKTKEHLKDLLNYKYIWNDLGNPIMSIDNLSKELLEDKEILKSCMSYGENLIELRNQNNKWYFDKELKEIALRTYPHYQIIEDCLDDKNLVLLFIKNIEKNNFYSGINLFEQTKRIGEELFNDREVMLEYISLKNLNEKNFIVKNAIESLKNYSTEELIELIKINKEVYKVLPEELKNKWELIVPFYEKNKGISNEMPENISKIINKTKITFEEKIIEISKYALNEKLEKNLDEKGAVRRLKI